jgi:hypothetical protein
MFIALVLLLLSGTVSLYASGVNNGQKPPPRILRVWSGMAYSREQYIEAVNRFNLTRGTALNMRIEYVVYGSEYQAVIDRAASMLEEPDIFEARPADVARWARGDRLLPLTELPDRKSVV